MDEQQTSVVHSAGEWLWRNRRKVLAVAIVAIPLVARYVPGFPAEDVLSVLRMVLGA